MTFTPPSWHYRILYQDDHQARARALDSAKSQPIEQPASTVHKMDTLIFWGHGTPATLCGLGPEAIADLVRSWRGLNNKISTVEILTCNSRHCPQGQDPFVTLLRRELGFRLRKVKIKSMPIRSGEGGLHGDSVLFADAPSRTWCYLTAANPLALKGMWRLFKEICEEEYQDDAVRTAVYLMNPPPMVANEDPPANPFSKYAPEIADIHGSDQIMGWLSAPGHLVMKQMRAALKEAAFRREFVRTRKYSMNYGTFNTLRSQLVTV